MVSPSDHVLRTHAFLTEQLGLMEAWAPAEGRGAGLSGAVRIGNAVMEVGRALFKTTSLVA
jgi:hypothetical protein